MLRPVFFTLITRVDVGLSFFSLCLSVLGSVNGYGCFFIDVTINVIMTQCCPYCIAMHYDVQRWIRASEREEGGVGAGWVETTILSVL